MELTSLIIDARQQSMCSMKTRFLTAQSCVFTAACDANPISFSKPSLLAKVRVFCPPSDPSPTKTGLCGISFVVIQGYVEVASFKKQKQIKKMYKECPTLIMALLFFS